MKRFFLFIENNSFWVIIAAAVIIALGVLGWKYCLAFSIIFAVAFLVILLILAVYFGFLKMVNRPPMSITVLIVIFFLTGLLKAVYDMVTKTDFTWLWILVASAVFLAILNGVINALITRKEKAEEKAEKSAQQEWDDRFDRIYESLKDK